MSHLLNARANPPKLGAGVLPCPRVESARAFKTRVLYVTSMSAMSYNINAVECRYTMEYKCTMPIVTISKKLIRNILQ